METESLEKPFQHKVLGMLLRKGKITQDVCQAHHVVASFPVAFNVHCGPRIQPGDEEAMENLAPLRRPASFLQERMTYIPEEAKVVYRSRMEKRRRPLVLLSGLAAMFSHVPRKEE